MTERTLGREQAIYRVTWIGFAVNLVLSAGKLAAGIWGHSAAMVADAIHSVSDFATDLVVLLFVRVSAKPRDDDHDYGHGKYETLATLIIGVALAGVGIKLLWSGGTAIRDFTRGLLPTQPGVVALWAAVVSIVAKEALYRYTARVGRRVNSPSVVANAWHHRSDALSSLGTLAGIGCAYFLGQRWRLADPAAAIVVALLILRVAWQLMKMGMDELLEKSLPREQEEHILSLIAADPAVASPHNLRTRRIGQNIAVEVHIRVDGAMTVTESHRLTVDIERRLREHFTVAGYIFFLNCATPTGKGRSSRSMSNPANSRRSTNRSKRPSNCQVRRSVFRTSGKSNVSMSSRAIFRPACPVFRFLRDKMHVETSSGPILAYAP